MRRIIPDGWPGLVGIAVVVIGSALAVGTPRVSEVGGFANSEFFFTYERGPDLDLAVAGVGALNQEADAAAVALGDEGYAERSLTLVATFDTNADARRAADSIALEAPARMLILDRIVVAYHLVPDPEDDPVPVATQLTGLGADVLVQGDRLGEGQVVADITCRAADHDAAAKIAAPLADYPTADPYARPPWVGPPLTADEELARSTYRRWATGFAEAFANDPWMGQYADRFLAADSEAEYAALNAELQAHVRELQVGGIGGEVPPGGGGPPGIDADRHRSGSVHRVAARAEPPDGTVAEVERRAAKLAGPATGRLFGGHSGSRRPRRNWLGHVQQVRAGLHGAAGLPDQQRCEDVRVRLTDYDDVRLD